MSNKKINFLKNKSAVIGGVIVLTISLVSISFAALTLNSTNVTSDGALVLDAATTISVGTATSTGVTIGMASTTTNVSGTLIVFASATIRDAFFVSSTANVSGTLRVNSTFFVSSTANVSGTLTVAASATIKDALFVATTANVTSTLTVNGTFFVSSTANMSSTLTVKGSSTLASTTISGSLTINSGPSILNHLSATGSITFGILPGSGCNSSSTVTVTGARSGDAVYAAPVQVASGIETVSSSVWSAYASSTNDLVSIRACNVSLAPTASIAAQVWRVDVWQH